MRILLAVLLCLSAAAGAVTITLTPEQLTAITNQQGAAAPPPVVAPPPVSPPPVDSPLAGCSGRAVLQLGELQFNGAQLNSTGMNGGTIAYGRIEVPNPLPAAWIGKQASVAVFANGGATAWRKVALSRRACDFTTATGNIANGVTASVSMLFSAASPFAVTLQPGEVWYVNVANQLPYGGTSCPVGSACEFGLRLYPPGS